MANKKYLIDLIIDAKLTAPERGSFVEWLADYLIAYGVIIPVRCKDCKHYIAYSKSVDGLVEWGKCREIDMDIDMPGNGYCCFGERRNNES